MLEPSHRRLTRILLTLGWVIGVLVGPAGMAVADEPPVSLSLKAVDQPGPYFDLTLDAGQSQQLKVELGNHGSATISARTYAADAYSLINGGFGAGTRDGTPTGTTTWLSYPTEVLQLPAGQVATRAFTVAVPAGTAPGEYISSLILENDVPVQGSGSVVLNQIIRQAVAVSIRVPGPLQPAFTIGTASHKITADRSVVDVQIANTGNTKLKPSGNLIIHDHNGKTISQAPVTMDSFYAHTDTLVETTLAGKLQPGDYTVDLTLTDPTTKVSATGAGLPFTVKKQAVQHSTGAQQGQLPQILQDASTGIGPYLAAALAVLAVLLFLVIRGRRRGRRRRLVSPGPGRHDARRTGQSSAAGRA